MTSPLVTVNVHHNEIDLLMLSQNVRDMLHDTADPVVTTARMLAPKDTGRGARSIHSEVILELGGWQAYVSWSWPEAYYLYWHELGSERMPARPFLVPALWAAS